jgi:hypothetical protein
VRASGITGCVPRLSPNPDARSPGGVGPRVRLRPLVDQVVRLSIRPLDRGLRWVFERDVHVRSVEHAEALLAEVSAREAASSRIGTWVALAASLRPIVLRVARRAQTAGRVARFSGVGRVAAWSVTGTIAVGRVVDATRAGVSELQVMAAYLASRVRAVGRVPYPRAVELAALSLYAKPCRPIDLTQSRRAAVGAAARRWVLDAVRPENDDARRRRMRVRLEAIARLPDDELRRLVDVIPATLHAGDGRALGR